MREALVPTGVHATWQGIGWVVDLGRAAAVLRHDGDYPGYTTAVAVIPGLRAGIVVLTNGSRGDRVHGPIVEGFLDEMLGPREVRPASAGTPPPLDPLAGRYGQPEYGAVDVTPAGSTDLLVGWGSGDDRREERFRWVGDTTFEEIANPLWQIAFFAPDPTGRPDVIRLDARLGGRIRN
jgi:hypothetical protein